MYLVIFKLYLIYCYIFDLRPHYFAQKKYDVNFYIDLKISISVQIYF